MLESLRRGNVGLWITAALFVSYVILMLLRVMKPAWVHQATASFVALFS
jgi:hypothetical protein